MVGVSSRQRGAPSRVCHRGGREVDMLERGSLMSRVRRSKAELSPAELAAFREWFAEFDARAWDWQFAADVKGGKLDGLGEKALEDRAAGRSREL